MKLRAVILVLLAALLALAAGARTGSGTGGSLSACTTYPEGDGCNVCSHCAGQNFSTCTLLACVRVGRPRLTDLMPIVEPLPPPRKRGHRPNPLLAGNINENVELDGQLPHNLPCNPTDSKVGRALLLCGQLELLDVPAIQETSKERCFYEDTKKFCIDHTPLRWTCADPTRVLLTDESGKRHCILFGGTQ